MTESTQRVVVIGTGAIGTAVVRRLLAAGREVTVWNRTPGRTTELATAGAKVAGDLPTAAAAGPLLLLTRKDQAAVRACLDGLGPDLAGRTVISMCTGTPAEARSAAVAGNRESPHRRGSPRVWNTSTPTRGFCSTLAAGVEQNLRIRTATLHRPS